MMIHVALEGSEGPEGFMAGLCGKPVIGFYVRSATEQARLKSHLCPDCKARASVDEGSTAPDDSGTGVHG
jgi:hypothetical protein